MVRLTRAGEYAVRGMVHLARKPKDELILIADIAKSEGVSVSFLAKIFQKLSKVGLIESQRGATGGVSVGRVPSEISLKLIIEAIEGPFALNRCLLIENKCDRADGCLISNVWHKAQSKMLEVLEEATLDQFTMLPESAAGESPADSATVLQSSRSV